MNEVHEAVSKVPGMKSIKHHDEAMYKCKLYFG